MISKEEIADVKLLDVLLEQAHEGNALNGLMLQNPTCMGFFACIDVSLSSRFSPAWAGYLTYL